MSNNRLLIALIICWSVCLYAVSYAQDTQLFVVDEPVDEIRPSTGDSTSKISIHGKDLWVFSSPSIPNGYRYFHDETNTLMIGQIRAAVAGKQLIRMLVPKQYKNFLLTAPEFYAHSIIDAAVRSRINNNFVVFDYLVMCWAHRQEVVSEGDEPDPTNTYKTYRVTLKTFMDINDPNKVLLKAYIPFPVMNGNQGNAFEYKIN